MIFYGDPQFGCFTGDTKISLLDGTERTLDSFTKGEKFWVYGCKPDGTVLPVEATALGITKYVNELVEVTLDNGASERCTLDHLWMLRDGTYKEAKDLQSGDSLMPKLGENHKVVSTRTIHFTDPISVYDIHSPETSNFALSAGVFVHNSTGDFSYPSISGYTTRIDNTLASCHWLARTIVELKPKIVVGLGDLFEEQGVIGAVSLSAAAIGMGVISKACKEVGAMHYVLIGNHDLCTESGSIYSPAFLNYYPNTKVIDTPVVLEDSKLALIPYTSDYSYLSKILAEIPSDYVIGFHFDVKEIKMTISDYISESGIDKNTLSRFKLAVFGHVHTPQIVVFPNVICLGSLIQLSYDQRSKDLGRGILDVADDGTYKLIENPFAPLLIKVRDDIELLKTLPQNSYVIFESEKLTEEEAVRLLSKFAKFRFVPIRNNAPVIEARTLKSTEPNEVLVEYLDQVKTPLERDILKEHGLDILSKVTIK